jgi:ribosomal protein S18 acetylase RimI-like enzyme
MKIMTREATHADIAQVAALFDQYRQFYEQEANPALALNFITERFEKSESVILVADAPDGNLAGFCQLYPTFCSVEAAPIYALYDLFVQPAARKHGVGRLLLQAAEAKALATGRARLDLTTAKTNLPAQRLYESLGWIRDEVFFAYNRWPEVR